MLFLDIVPKGTFDGNKLAVFQKDNSIMREYFSLYIQYLTEVGSNISMWYSNRLPQYRQHYQQVLAVPRFVDVAVNFKIQANILVDFARWCGISSNEAISLEEMFEEKIVEVMSYNQHSSKAEKPEVKFVYALIQSVNSNEKSYIAKNEAEYAAREAKFIGFYEGDKKFLWLRFEEAMELVQRYYRKLGEDWLISGKKIKEVLFEQGISRGVIQGKQREFLIKAKKGTRKRMLVLKSDEMEKVLNKESGDE